MNSTFEVPAGGPGAREPVFRRASGWQVGRISRIEADGRQAKAPRPSKRGRSGPAIREPTARQS